MIKCIFIVGECMWVNESTRKRIPKELVKTLCTTDIKHLILDLDNRISDSEFSEDLLDSLRKQIQQRDLEKGVDLV